MNLYDLIPRRLLDDALEQGLVRRQTHPELPLAILNYTERAAYDGLWNEATLTCRGLIYDVETTAIVARPFPKFFNYGQPGAPELDLDAPAVVTEKMDGSLGILYPLPESGRYAVATRGSFESAQAIHATAVWIDRYQDVAAVRPGLTYLFEIVYPLNRIVCDYGELDDLILLDAIDVETGESWGPPYAWPGPVVSTHPYRTLAEALAAEPRPNAEGLVVYLPESGVRAKIKQADYVALHRIVTGLNKRTVWQHLDEGRPLAELVEPLPDEFRPWVEDVAAELAATVAAQAGEIEREFDRIVAELDLWMYVGAEGSPPFENGWRNAGVPDVEGKPWSRKQFAELATKTPWAWALFLRLDGKDYGPKLWRLNRPDPETPAGRVYTEDVA